MGTASDATTGRRHHPNLKDMVAVLRFWRVHVDETGIRLAVATQTTCLPEILEKNTEAVIVLRHR